MSSSFEIVCEALAFAQCSVLEVEGGFQAVVTIDTTALDEHQVEMLSRCLTGKADSMARKFISPVADNDQVPVVFGDADLANSEAHIRAGSLVKQFIYGVYADTGIVVKYSSSPTLVFRPRK